MAELTVQTVSLSGLEATYAAASGGGDTFAKDGHTMFHAINGSGGDITLTFVDQATSIQQAGHGSVTTADETVVVTAGEERMVGPFPKSRFNSLRLVSVTYSGVTSLTVAAIKVPKAG